jgi:hypothetical protein
MELLASAPKEIRFGPVTNAIMRLDNPFFSALLTASTSPNAALKELLIPAIIDIGS